MEKDIQLAQDLKLDVKLTGGKVFVTIEFDGADAALDALKPKLPTWLAPLIDLAKTEVDSL